MLRRNSAATRIKRKIAPFGEYGHVVVPKQWIGRIVQIRIWNNDIEPCNPVNKCRLPTPEEFRYFDVELKRLLSGIT